MDLTNICGVIRRYNEYDELEECFMNNGIKEGINQEYYTSGQLYIWSNYINGKKYGAYYQYIKNYQLYQEIYYLNDELHGSYIMYTRFKIIYSSEYYIRNKKNGLQKYYYYNTGRMFMEEYYIDGNMIY